MYLVIGQKSLPSSFFFSDNLDLFIFLLCVCLCFLHQTGLSCNFETDLCGWYQDQMDSYDWRVQDGIDHTIGIGTENIRLK